MSEQRAPLLGDIVLYELRADEIDEINRHVASTRHGNEATAQPYPMVVTAVWSAECVNGVVQLDAPITKWRASVMRGEGPGKWLKRVELAA